MEEQSLKFIQSHSPDGGFLQSDEWRHFQEDYGRKTFHVPGTGSWANAIEHRLPLVGEYLYVPRGPILEMEGENLKIQSDNEKLKKYLSGLIDIAVKNNIGWIRIEPATEELYKTIKQNLDYKLIKAPHDTQPKEIFVIDIARSEEEILAAMKPKTRYNIRLAEKKGIKIARTEKKDGTQGLEEFLKLVKTTSERQGIASHPEGYYQKMWETLPENMLRLYVAEYEGKVIAANLVLYFGKWATYLHGASDNKFREVMAPYLLQWQAIRDAKTAGYEHYDFGGVDISGQRSGWEGITRFKLGFSPAKEPIVFPGTYDIIISGGRYWAYRILQKIKSVGN